MREKYVDSPEKEPDRYLALCDVWREKYLEMDRKELKERFHLDGDERTHYITYFNQRYRLDQEIRDDSDGGRPERILPFNAVMTIYHRSGIQNGSQSIRKICALPGGKAGIAL